LARSEHGGESAAAGVEQLGRPQDEQRGGDVADLEQRGRGEIADEAGAAQFAQVQRQGAPPAGPACRVEVRKPGSTEVAISCPASEKKLAAPTLATPPVSHRPCSPVVGAVVRSVCGSGPVNCWLR
jgi:hypothetical protein